MLAGCSTSDNESRPPQLGVQANDEQAAEKLGFPSSATRNTIRVGGSDAASDAAGVAGALYPATGDSDRPTAVVLVDQNDWATAIAASVLVGRPIGAPILLSDGSDLPAVSKDVLDHLDPKGSDLSKDAQVIRVGPDVARPEGYKTALIEGGDPFERAAAIDRFYSAARGKPSNDVVLYSADDAEFAMPAASWAARSGDSVLPVRRNRIPAPVAKTIEEHSKPNVFVLGPESVISEKVITRLEKQKLARNVERIEGPNAVENAIAFARYEKGDFGWGVVVPGYNFALANTARPADAAAAAALATRGVFAPLVLTDDANKMPQKLEEYFLSVQPGYEEDPSQAVYNRAWVLGDDKAVSVDQQAQLDQLTELIPVQSNAP
ncbi:MAG TPA: cell wall-binding repeat-containing protein [Thermoleophilaceae bacterium]|nr:cell wall-binding repeat-containing protein [Thermoleophilaceae bacterium]